MRDVRFSNFLRSCFRLSVEMNIYGVRGIIEICKKMKQLTSFVHISTAYSNCDQEVIKEEIYPPPLYPKQLLSACEYVLLLQVCITSCNLFLTRYHTMPHFDTLRIYSCGKHWEKRRNCLLQAISTFLTMFSTIYGTYFSF